MHGYDQSRNHAKAARHYSWARHTLDVALRAGGLDDIERAEVEVKQAKAMLDEAFKIYTNPFGVRKWA